MIQLLSRFFVGNQYRTNVGYPKRQKTEASCKINNYFSDLIIILQQLEYKYCSYFADTCLFVNSFINRTQLLPGC
jgi:hypothetical protein